MRKNDRALPTGSYTIGHFVPGLLFGILLGGMATFALMWNGPVKTRNKVIEEQSQHKSKEPAYAVIENIRMNAETCRAETNEHGPVTIICNEQTDGRTD